MFIAHRINALTHDIAKEVFATCDGIEFDLRDSNGHLIVQHDACKTGQFFSDFLLFCPSHAFYIVNIKAEGIEEMAIQMLEAAGIKNFFLLDCGIPAIMKLKRQGETRIAVRFSEVEPLESVERLRSAVTWVWVDCFHSYPLTRALADQFHAWGLNICLVSPELQGRTEEVTQYVEKLKQEEIPFDAVCSKHWNRHVWATLQN